MKILKWILLFVKRTLYKVGVDISFVIFSEYAIIGLAEGIITNDAKINHII